MTESEKQLIEGRYQLNTEGSTVISAENYDDLFQKIGETSVFFKPKSNQPQKGFYGRQGDVIISPVSEEELTSQSLEIASDLTILAEGEVTGHKHQLIREKVEGQFEVYESGSRTLYLKILEPTVLQHEEHHPLTIPPGIYSSRIQREYEPGGWRDVID